MLNPNWFEFEQTLSNTVELELELASFTPPQTTGVVIKADKRLQINMFIEPNGIVG